MTEATSWATDCHVKCSRTRARALHVAVRGPRGRLRHRRGRGALTSRDVPPPDLRAASRRQTSVQRPAARPPCGARPARPLAVRAASFARRVVSKPGQAQQASRRPPVGRPVLPGPATTHRRRSHLHPSRPRAALQSGDQYYLALPPPTSRAAAHAAAAIPAGHASLFLWLPRLLLHHMTTAGNTPDEISK